MTVVQGPVSGDVHGSAHGMPLPVLLLPPNSGSSHPHQAGLAGPSTATQWLLLRQQEDFFLFLKVCSHQPCLITYIRDWILTWHSCDCTEWPAMFKILFYGPNLLKGTWARFMQNELQNFTLGLSEHDWVARSLEARAGGSPCLVWTAHFQRINQHLRSPFKASKGWSHSIFFRLLFKASCTEIASWPVYSSPTKHALYSPTCSWIFSHSLIFIQNGPPTCLLKCYGPFRPSPSPASSTKSPRSLHSSLLFLLWHLLVPTHSLLLWDLHKLSWAAENVSHFHA